MPDDIQPPQEPDPWAPDEPRTPWVAFRVVCHGLDPQHVSAVTGLTPTDISDGGPLGGQVGPYGHRHPTGSWTLAVLPSPDRTLDAQVGRLLDQLEPHVETLRALPDCRLYVLLDMRVNSPFSEWNDDLSVETLAHLAALGATLSLEVMCDTCY